MSTRDKTSGEAARQPGQTSAEKASPRKPRSIEPCTFRAPGQLTNEDARLLSSMHESLARQLAGALYGYFRSELTVKLEGIEQHTLEAHVAGIRAFSCIVPFSSNSVFLEFDPELTFSIVELLMGGNGSALHSARELSEIEEEILHEVTLLIAHKAEAAWPAPGFSQTVSPRIRPPAILECRPAREMTTVVRFSVEMPGACGSMNLVLSAGFVEDLLKKIKVHTSNRRSRVRAFPMPPLHERILDCDVLLTTELTGLRVTVRDLISLQSGSVLKLRAPIRLPARLTAGGRSMFEAAPVRSGAQRAAQLGGRISARDLDWRQA